MTSTLIDDEAPTRPHLPIDPRIRRRLVEVQREQGRRRLRALLGFTGVIVMVAAVLAVLHSPLVKVRHVRVQGASATLTAATVRQAVGLDHQALMVDVSAADDVRRLEGLAQVAGATVTRQWPGTVRISVTIRTGVAAVVAGTERAVVDRTGRVLAIGPAVGSRLPTLLAQASVATLRAVATLGAWLPGSAGPGLQALKQTAPGTGDSASVDPGAVDPGAVDPARPLPGELALAAMLDQRLQGDVQTVAVSPTVGLVATVAAGASAAATGIAAGVGAISVVFGDTTQLAAKVRGLAAVLAQGSLPGVTLIDLRVPDRPALTGGSSGSTVSATKG